MAATAIGIWPHLDCCFKKAIYTNSNDYYIEIFYRHHSYRCYKWFSNITLHFHIWTIFYFSKPTTPSHPIDRSKTYQIPAHPNFFIIIILSISNTNTITPTLKHPYPSRRPIITTRTRTTISNPCLYYPFFLCINPPHNNHGGCSNKTKGQGA